MTGAAVEQATATMEGKFPSLCRLCSIPMAGVNEWREHAKSELHVYNLRLSIAEGEYVVSPPASPTGRVAVEADNDLHHVNEMDEIDAEPSEMPGFDPAQCLFCGARNGTFNDNLRHMSKEHSFAVPYQDRLLVEPETLVRYLHLVVYGYGECILCATRRNTVGGIQHHMMAKGHCRFNVASDILDFYDVPLQEWQAAGELLRLPSGKLIGHRAGSTGSALPRRGRCLRESRGTESRRLPRASPSHASDLIALEDNSTAAASHPQLSRLSRGDQQSLAHLPDHELQSLLATSARHLNRWKREEKDAQLKLERAGNITLTGHFRMDTSKRYRGPWG
ncbi:C2H2 type zinc-finger domain-containing protein [Trichoderma aethiopicum]